MGKGEHMHNLVNEVYHAIQSSRITNVKDCIGDIVSVLEEDKQLFDEVEKHLDRKDILWFNKNNGSLFFEIPKENHFKSCVTLDIKEEILWLKSEITSTSINWNNIKYRYQKALKSLGSKDVIYYNNIRELMVEQYEDKWRYINE
jgi:hypothetical protein